jgi:hypothetical protein
MRGLSLRITTGVALLTAIGVSGVLAQQPQTMRVRGTIEKVDGNTVVVKSSDGAEVTLTLTANAAIVGVVKATLADIKPGSFVGSAAMPQADGSQKAIGLHIFMDAQRGVVAAAHTPWDREPGSTMTNADVASTVASVDGQTLMVKYKDGEKKVIVPPTTPVVRFNPGTKDDLKPGAQFFIVAGTKQDDGTIAAAAINVGRDGIAPPM